MPRISIRVKGELSSRLSGGATVCEVAVDTTLQSLLSDLGLSAMYYVIILNNTVSPDRSTILKDGDSVIIYPQMAGG